MKTKISELPKEYQSQVKKQISNQNRPNGNFICDSCDYLWETYDKRLDETFTLCEELSTNSNWHKIRQIVYTTNQCKNYKRKQVSA